MAKPATTTNRSNARETATGAGQTAGTGRKPAPREEGGENGGGATATEALPQMDPKLHSLINIAGNPKRPNSQSYDFYNKYAAKGQLSDIFAARQAGVRGKDISWDRDPTRRHILVGQEALDFHEICQGDVEGNRGKCAEYLKKIGVPEKNLIKWGWMDEPKPPVTEPAKQTENA